MFLGTFLPKLDEKSRLTLPAKFRQLTKEELVVAKGQDHCLAVYPGSVFAELAKKIAKTSRINQINRAYLRALAAGAEEQIPDSQGRIVISSEHRRYANLSKTCVVIGALEYFEIWDEQNWKSYSDQNEEAYSQATDISLETIL